MLPPDRDVRYGDHSINEAARIVDKLDAKRVLLVCGKNAFEASGASGCLPELVKAASVRRWSEFRANTDALDLIEGLRLVEELRPDVILGIGGGSAMDMSKLLCAYQGITDEARLHEAIRANAAVTERSMNLVLAPTTSGSGSEATHFAVVYIGESKFSIAGPAMLPDTVILDPALTTSASPYQRAASGIDAVAQAMESLWSAGGDEDSREFAIAALNVLIPSFPEFARTGSEESARQMALGSHLAGRAIDVSKTTAAHAMSYGITKTYGLPHGHAVALTLQYFIGAHAEATAEQLQPGISADRHQAAMSTVLSALGADSPAAARERFVALAADAGLSLNLAEFGITDREKVADLASRVNVERMGNNPVKFTADTLAALLSRDV